MPKRDRDTIRDEYKNGVLNKINSNDMVLKSNILIEGQLNDKIKKIETETASELKQLLKEFNDKHGLTKLRQNRDKISNDIKKYKDGPKKYGSCKHPKYAHVRASRGWSGSYRCTICQYEDIDLYGPGN